MDILGKYCQQEGGENKNKSKIPEHPKSEEKNNKRISAQIDIQKQ